MKEVKGNLLTLAKEGKFDVIVHGCNCYHTMGAGLALQIAKQYPQASEADRIHSVYGDPEKLGTYTQVTVQGDNDIKFTILNGYTQYQFGANLKHVKYDAVDELFKKIAKQFSNARIGVPMIGAGLAGGDWEVIKVIISRALVDCDVTFVEYKS